MIKPLTTAQRAAVDALVKDGRVVPVPVDLVRAAWFLGNARDLLAEPPKLTIASARHTLAYDACHDAESRCWRRTVSAPPMAPAL